MTITPKRWATVNQTAATHEAFSIASLRWLIFNKQTNGFSKCVRKIGRKVLIDLDQFEAWVDAQQGGN